MVFKSIKTSHYKRFLKSIIWVEFDLEYKKVDDWTESYIFLGIRNRHNEKLLSILSLK